MMLFNFTKPTHISLKLDLLTMKDYLLSNNFINDIISFNFDFTNEEFLAYYISFLKSLALKTSAFPIALLYNEVLVLIFINILK